MGMAIGAAAQFVAKELGGDFRLRQTTVSVDAASVVVAPNDPDRVWLAIINTGATTITLSFRPTAVPGVGLLLLDNGSIFAVNVRDDMIMTAWQYAGIGDGAGGSLEVFEITRSS